jgi:hypothetical protein
MKICTICDQHIVGGECVSCSSDAVFVTGKHNPRGVLALSVLLGLSVGCSSMGPM